MNYLYVDETNVEQLMQGVTGVVLFERLPTATVKRAVERMCSITTIEYIQLHVFIPDPVALKTAFEKQINLVAIWLNAAYNPILKLILTKDVLRNIRLLYLTTCDFDDANVLVSRMPIPKHPENVRFSIESTSFTKEQMDSVLEMRRRGVIIMIGSDQITASQQFSMADIYYGIHDQHPVPRHLGYTPSYFIATQISDTQRAVRELFAARQENPVSRLAVSTLQGATPGTRASGFLDNDGDHAILFRVLQLLLHPFRGV